MAKRPQPGWGRLAVNLARLEGRALTQDEEIPVIERARGEVLVLSLEGAVLDANTKACRAHECDLKELSSRSIWDLNSRQTPQTFARLVDQIRAQGVQVVFAHHRRRDGSSYPVRAHFWIEKLSGVERVIEHIEDAAYCRELIEERDLLMDLIENSADAIAVTAPDGKINYMNQTGLDLVGAERAEEVVGRPFESLLQPDDQETLVERILPELQRRHWQGELIYQKRSNGERTPCSVNAFALRRGEQGQVTGIAFLAQDISRRKEAERKRERIRDLNEVSRRVATSLLEHDDLNRAISIILQGVGEILDCCRAFLCRYRNDRSLLFRTHEWTAETGLVQQLPRVPESSGPYERATEVLLRGEVIRIGDVSRSPFDLGSEEERHQGGALLRPDVKAILIMPVIIRGRLQSFFGFADTRGPREWGEEEFAILQIIVESFARAVERRIAERERALVEKELERAVEREKLANRYKSDFLASMSHELRTPMNAIVGYAELLGRSNVDEERRSTWIENIQRSTDHLLSLINDVLDLSKIEAGQMTLEYEDYDLARLISDVMRLLEGAANEALLELVAEVKGDVPQVIHTDPVRFKQILINLVGNAIKYTESGSVTVLVSMGGMVDAPSLRVAVIDTGLGIAPEQLKNLFQPFSRLGQGGKKGPSGTGLGLDIARRLARLFGGEIEVKSRVGVGSTFTLELPLRPLSGAESVTVQGSQRDLRVSGASVESTRARDELGGARILVVDDSAENRDVLRFLLQESGAQVEEAENGALGVKAALEALAGGRPFDLVLMDMNMPVLDGLAATRKLRRAGYEGTVIALTAMALAEDSRRCLEAGADDFIAKPVVPKAFLEAIFEHVEHRPEEADGGPPPPAETVARATQAGEGQPTPALGGATLSLADNPRFAPLVQRYLASFPEQVAQMRLELEDGSLDALRTRVHRLRGTAANYGFPEITELAGACEDAIRAGQGLEQVAAELEPLCQRLEFLSE